MIVEKTVKTETVASGSLKIADYIAFTKLRLSLLVLFSAVIGYLMATPSFSWIELICLCFGGLFITIGSNGMNQVIERESDKLMKRTMKRPLPTAKMSVNGAIILVCVFTSIGFLFLWFGNNPLTAILSLSSSIVYAFIYTPVKKKSSIAVFVGAFPGAVPPLLGWVAATGNISYEAILLFATQFMWQFPHFWAIAWRVDDEYKKAGFQMLPFSSGRTKENAFQILLYTLILVPVSLLAWAFGYSNPATGILVGLSSLVFLYPAWMLYRTCSMQWATRLMFASFLYLPVIQILTLINL